MAIETYFKNIADAIREKAGTSGLITPAQMSQAIADIPSGGSSPLITPLAVNVRAYIDSSGNYIPQAANSDYRTDIYAVTPGKKYILYFGEITSNPNRLGQYTTNPLNATGALSGYLRYDLSSRPNSYYIYPTQILAENGMYYFAVYKTYYNRNDIQTFLFESGV